MREVSVCANILCIVSYQRSKNSYLRVNKNKFAKLSFRARDLHSQIRRIALCDFDTVSYNTNPSPGIRFRGRFPFCLFIGSAIKARSVDQTLKIKVFGPLGLIKDEVWAIGLC